MGTTSSVPKVDYTSAQFSAADLQRQLTSNVEKAQTSFIYRNAKGLKITY